MERKLLLGNHPLLFGTVSPTCGLVCRSWVEMQVTTPYCSGLSLLQSCRDLAGRMGHLVTTPYCSGLSLLRTASVASRRTGSS